MVNVIKNKNSTSAGNVPASLVVGELALNHTDRKLFARGPGGGVEDVLKDWRPQGISGFTSGKPAANEVVAGGIATAAFNLTAANCAAKAKTGATASTTFTIYGGATGSTALGTIVFAAAGVSATVTITTAAVAAGDYLNIVGPATPDATLADIAWLVRN